MSEQAGWPQEAAIMEQIVSTGGVDLDSIVRFIAGELGAQSAQLSVREHGGRELQVYTTQGSLGSLGLEGDDTDPPIAEVLERGKPVAKRLRGARNRDLPEGDGPIAEALMAPVQAPSGAAGVLSIGFLQPLGAEREMVLQATNSYAGLLGLWLDDRGLLVRMLRSAYEDGPTGCLTPFALIQELEQEMLRAGRTGLPLSCCFIRLEPPEAGSESEGRRESSRRAGAVAGCLTERVRTTDILGRWTADEFAVILPDTSGSGASVLADSLREGITQSTEKTLGSAVGASVTVAEWSEGMTITELLQQAIAA
jgi:diguanylate cyclase (GGDEF)-like protein